MTEMHKKRTALHAALGMGVLLGILSGCTQPTKKTPAPVDPATTQLAEAAQEIRASLSQLAEAEQFSKMRRMPGAVDLTPPMAGLNQTVSMPWNGPLEPIIVKLASYGGYEVEFAGKPPVLPILVSLGPKPATTGQLLRDVGLQAGDRADIVVDPARKKVGVVYANTGL